MRFEFAAAGRVVFGCGTRHECTSFARAFGTRALVVSGRRTTRADELCDELRIGGISSARFAVSGEPDIAALRAGCAEARNCACEMVVSIGGGSAIDAGKAIAALLTNEGDPLDFLEVVGRGKQLSQPSAPFVALPATAGTGSEVTRNAVIGSPEHGVKVSMRSPHMLPSAAIVDPELTYSMPTELTAATGLDALTQLIEPFVSTRANPLTDGICREGLRRAASSLQRAWSDGSDTKAREDMSFASLCGGLALANAGLGAVHGLAGPLGGMLGAPHGALCACLLPHVMAANIRALRARASHSPALERYALIAQVITGTGGASAEEGVEWVRALCEALRTPSLRQLGLDEQAWDEAAEKAGQASSFKANPIPLTHEELVSVIASASA